MYGAVGNSLTTLVQCTACTRGPFEQSNYPATLFHAVLLTLSVSELSVLFAYSDVFAASHAKLFVELSHFAHHGPRAWSRRHRLIYLHRFLRQISTYHAPNLKPQTLNSEPQTVYPHSSVSFITPF